MKHSTTLGLKFRRKFFEKTRQPRVSFRARAQSPPGSTMISQDPRVSTFESERRRGEKRFHARDLDEDQAWSDRWRCVCGIPWSSVNFTRLETVKPDPDHVEDAHPGIRGTWIPDRDISIYLSSTSMELLWKTKPSRTFSVLFDRTLNSSSFHSIVFFFLFDFFLFSLQWLFFLSCLFTAFDNGMLFLCTT